MKMQNVGLVTPEIVVASTKISTVNWEKSHMRMPLPVLLSCALFLSACLETTSVPELDAIAARADLSGVSTEDLCDTAGYLTYDAPQRDQENKKRILDEVLKRGDISRREYNAAMTGDVFLGMSENGAICAWGLPNVINEYLLAGGRTTASWVYRTGEYDIATDFLGFVNGRITRISASGVRER